MFPFPLPELPLVANAKIAADGSSLLSYQAFTDDSGDDIIAVFDQFDRLITMTTVVAAFDPFSTDTYAYEGDRVAAMTHSDGDGWRHCTEFQYDADGRVTSALTYRSSALISTSTLTYGDRQVTEEIIDAEGKRTVIFCLDDAGRVLGSGDELVVYRLDEFGRVTSTEDSEPQSRWRPRFDGRVLHPGHPGLGRAADDRTWTQ